MYLILISFTTKTKINFKNMFNYKDQLDFFEHHKILNKKLNQCKSILFNNY
jgi:hypothetical protein